MLRTVARASPKNLTADLPSAFRGPWLRGRTVGDDSYCIGHNYLAVADGVGVWNTQRQGHAGLWSRLMVHEWSLRADLLQAHEPPPAEAERLMREALHASHLSASNLAKHFDKSAEWYGTTTMLAALYAPSHGVLYVCNLGDSALQVYDREHGQTFATEETREYFDVPRQVGTNAERFTFGEHAMFYTVPLRPTDTVVSSSDGLTDNLFTPDIYHILYGGGGASSAGGDVPLATLAEQLVEQAMQVGGNSWAESPYMERAVTEGIAFSGGKRDDCTVLLSRVEEAPAQAEPRSAAS